MPRVSQEHLDARRRQILDAARVCFVRNGFHMTSMQDILREADLSAGAVYRYFRSKDEIIKAIAGSALEEFTSSYDELLAEATDLTLNGGIDGLIDTMSRYHRTHDLPKLIVTVWGEAMRSPELAAMYGLFTERLRSLLTTGGERLEKAGQLPEGMTPDGFARVVIGVLQGNILQMALMDADPEVFRTNLHALLAAATAPARPKGAVVGPQEQQ
ncbi:TetR/AcrR family transcriptional regulator [Streptomyces palmae]|nr:TetR/AcrR family transcriptional regulator [Streptomyces palmae]